MSVIAIGGGKGGVGRTLVASGLAVFIAQLGKKVLLVDGHSHAPTLAPSFGVMRTDGSMPAWAWPSGEPRGMETSVPNLRVLTAATELGAVPGVVLRRPRQIAAASGADQCIVDLGDGVSTLILDAMLEADAMVLVTTPEPSAVEALYRWLRHAYFRALCRAMRGRPAEIAALHAAARAAKGPPIPLRLAEQLAALSPEGAAVAWAELMRLRPRLVVNASRSRADLDLGEAMAVVARHRLGLHVDYLGHVEFDDAVVLASRRRRPLLVDSPAAKASRNLERVARKLLALEAGRGESMRPSTAAPPEPPTHYEVLALDRGASDEEIRRAYRKMRDIYSPDSLAIAGLMTEGEISAATARIEEARDVLLDPSRRRAYDLSTTPIEELSAAVLASTLPAQSPEPQPVDLPEITPETEFSGDLLRRVREARGVEIKDIAARTKISPAHLRAIEAEEYASLPAAVYLRGFVAEIAKFLRLDVEQVTRTYLRRFRSATEGGAIPRGR